MQGLTEPPGTLENSVPALQLGLSGMAAVYFLRNEHKITNGAVVDALALSTVCQGTLHAHVVWIHAAFADLHIRAYGPQPSKLPHSRGL